MSIYDPMIRLKSPREKARILRGRVLLLFGFYLLGHAWIGLTLPEGNPEIPGNLPTSGSIYAVVRVVDGDTVVLDVGGRATKVRLMGIDTPETVHPDLPKQSYGKEASEFLTNLLGKERVRIATDPGQGEKDKYGRLLAYLYRYPDNLFINAEIIRQGYGRTYRKFDFVYKARFLALEREASKAGRGLWRKTGDRP